MNLRVHPMVILSHSLSCLMLVLPWCQGLEHGGITTLHWLLILCVQAVIHFVVQWNVDQAGLCGCKVVHLWMSPKLLHTIFIFGTCTGLIDRIVDIELTLILLVVYLTFRWQIASLSFRHRRLEANGWILHMLHWLWIKFAIIIYHWVFLDVCVKIGLLCIFLLP